MIGCMGGWCSQREKCAHYHAGGLRPAERLCGDKEEPEQMVREPVAAEPKRKKGNPPKVSRNALIGRMVRDGFRQAEIAELVGVSRQRVHVILRNMGQRA